MCYHFTRSLGLVRQESIRIREAYLAVYACAEYVTADIVRGNRICQCFDDKMPSEYYV
jgi:hypothetical protein